MAVHGRGRSEFRGIPPKAVPEGMVIRVFTRVPVSTAGMVGDGYSVVSRKGTWAARSRAAVRSAIVSSPCSLAGEDLAELNVSSS